MVVYSIIDYSIIQFSYGNTYLDLLKKGKVRFVYEAKLGNYYSTSTFTFT